MRLIHGFLRLPFLFFALLSAVALAVIYILIVAAWPDGQPGISLIVLVALGVLLTARTRSLKRQDEP